jgi:hypothetical protein
MGREEAPLSRAVRKLAVIRSQEKKKKWHVIQDQSAAFAVAKAPNFF